MKNQSKKAEKLEPKDSERKPVKHPENDNEAVVNSEDLEYHQKEADFGDIAMRKERGEQPVDPVKEPPQEPEG